MTATYVGLRAATEHRDYQLTGHPDQRYVCAGGIRSTGITGSLAIAEWVREALADAGLDLELQPRRAGLRMPNIGEFGARPYQEGRARSICFCERVTRGEIDAALRSPIPPDDLDGLRRRTRALMGRCQGFFCGAEVAACDGRPMTMAIDDGPVIVGGGPSGLAAAIELRGSASRP